MEKFFKSVMDKGKLDAIVRTITAKGLFEHKNDIPKYEACCVSQCEEKKIEEELSKRYDHVHIAKKENSKVFVCAYSKLFKHKESDDIFLYFLGCLYSEKDVTHISGPDYFRKCVNEFFYKKYKFCLNTIDYISCMPNEGRACKGKICFPKAETEYIEEADVFIELDTPESLVSLLSARNIRKLLELVTDKDFYLCVNSFKIAGIIKTSKCVSSVIRFNKFGEWVWSMNEEPILSAKGGFYLLPPPISEIDCKIDKIQKVFPCIDKALIKTIICNKYPNGALVMIASKDDIETEVKRLKECNRCIPISISKSSETEKLLLNFSKIDGAIFIDTETQIHAIGAILDGEGTAEEKSKISRGARYNSAKTYIANRTDGNPFCAIVISEDGMIDVFSE